MSQNILSVDRTRKLTNLKFGMERLVQLFLLSAVFALATYTIVRAAATITATKTYSFIGGDGDGKADPGETIEYTSVISNGGADATGVTFNDIIDANTTLVGGSLAVSPIAANDTYPQTVIGNVSIDSSLIPYSVVTNDFLGLNPTATISAYDATSAQGGTVTMTTSGAGLGQFTYNPPSGFEGTDTFTYTLTDNANATSTVANRQATVTINVSGMIWFINNNAPSCTVAGCGRLSNPFSTLAAFNSFNDGVGNHPANNDNIFVYESATTYTGGVILRARQKLIGQDATASLASLTGLTPGSGSASLPAMNAGAPSAAIDNASGNAVSNATDMVPAVVRGLTLSGLMNAIDLTYSTVVPTDPTRTIEIKDNTVASSGAEGIDINKDGNFTLTVDAQNNTWSGTSTGNGFDARTTATAGTTLRLNFSNNTNINSAAIGVFVDGSAGGTITITGFSNNTVSGNTVGNGININTAVFDSDLVTSGFQQVSAGATAIGASGNPVGGEGLLLAGGANLKGYLDFTDMDIFSTGAALDVTGSGTASTTTNTGFLLTMASGVGTLNASGGPAATITNATITLPFSTITSAGSSGVGVSLTSINDGANSLGPVASTFSAGAGSSITNATSTDFLINSNNADVTYAGTISDNNGGQLVSMGSNTGGTKSFTGAISNTGASTGISLTNNTSTTVSFSGGLSLSTGSNDAFTATGGGTVTATNTTSTITTTTGTAINVANTTIGASGLNFRSITAGTAASGPINGIILNNTGSSGGLTVTGNSSGVCGGNVTGSTPSLSLTAANSADCTGGTIQKATNAAISLTSTSNVSLTRMRLTNNTHYGIYGTTVNGFILSNSLIDGTNGSTAGGPPYDGSIYFQNLTGSASITNATITGGFYNNITVKNDSGTLNRLTLDKTQTGSTNVNNNDNVNFEILSGSSATLNVTIQNSVLTAAAGDLLQYTNNGTSGANGDLVVTNSQFTNNHPSIATGGGGVTLGTNGTGGFTYNITNNTFRDSVGSAFLLVHGGGSASMIGTLSGNTIGNSGVSNSGSLEGDAIKAQFVGGGGIFKTNITNNVISQYNNFGIDLLTGGGASATSGTYKAVVTGNTVGPIGSNTSAAQAQGIGMNGGTISGDSFQIYLTIGGTGADKNIVNNWTASNGLQDIRLRQRQSTTIHLTAANSGGTIDYSGGATNTAAVVTFLETYNTTSGNDSASVNSPPGGGFVGGTIAFAPDQTLAQDQPQDNSIASVQIPNTDMTAASTVELPSSDAKILAQAAVGELSNTIASANLGGGKPLFSIIQPRPMQSGETVNVTIGTLPAGKSVTIKYRVTVNGPALPLGTTQISNQGTVSSNELPDVLTDDPSVGGASDPTITPVDRPDTTVSSINRTASSSANSASVSWTVTFADAVSGLTASNFSLAKSGLTGASITSVTPVTASPDTQWTVTANTGTGDGLLGLNMENDTGLSHEVTNLLFFGQVYTIDKTPPTVTNVTSTNNNGCLGSNPLYCNAADTVSIQIMFSDNVNVTGTPTLALNSGSTASYVSGSGTVALTFNYTVASGENASDLDYTSINALSLNGGTIQDAATNNATLTLPTPGATGSLGFNNNIVIDTVAPTTTNFNRFNPSTTPTNADTLVWRAMFSEDVTGVDTNGSDFTIPALTGETISVSSVNASTYDVTVSGGDLANFNGLVDLDFVASPTITDLAGNALTNTVVGFDQHYVMDNATPTVTNITSSASDATYIAGALIPVTVTFSESVTVTGMPQLTLETGTTDRVVNYTSGSGTNTLTFNYIVQAGDTSSDLDYVGTGSLALNGGTIKDAVNNDANLTLPAPGSGGSLSFNKDIVIDTVSPTVANVTSTKPNGTYGTGVLIPVTVTFSEAVTVTGTPQLTLETGTTDRIASYTSGSGTTTLTFNYTTQAGDTSSDLDYVGMGSLALNGGTINDAATNSAILTLPTPGNTDSLGFNKNIVIDANEPYVINVTSTISNGSYKASSVIPITIQFSKAVTVTGTPQLTLETGSTDAVVNYTSGTGTDTLTFTYTVQVGNTSSDLDYVSTSALALNGGAIQDAAQNSATLTLPTPGAAGSLGANEDIVIDTTPPMALSIMRYNPATNPTNADILEFKVTFSEKVMNVGAADFIATGTTTQPDAISSITPNIDFGVTLDGTDATPGNLANLNGDVQLDFGGTVGITDLAGNSMVNMTLPPPSSSNDQSYTVDNTAPTVTINQAVSQSDPTSTSPINFTVTFSKAVNGFVTGDVDLGASTAPGTLTGTVTGGPTVYNVAVSGMTGDGNIVASIPASVASDSNSNLNAASTSTDNTVTYDATAPTVTINQASGQADPTGVSPINFTVIFSEMVTGFADTDVSLSGTANPSTAIVTGSGTSYNVAISGMTSLGTVIVSIPVGVASDAAGNLNTASTSTDNIVTFIDNIPPTVVSSLRADPNPTSASTVHFTVTFSESVTGVDSSDFGLTTAGLSGTIVNGVSGSGSTYTVTVDVGTGTSGTIRLDVLDDDSIKDIFNNPLGGAGSGNGNFITGETYTISKSANISVDIGGINQGTYVIVPQGSQRTSYTIDSGPVKIASTNGTPIIAALREAWKVNGQITSFAQLMGLPEEKLSDTYFFPVYNNNTQSEQIRFANVGSAPTTVTITIAGVVRGSYALNPNESKRVEYPGLDTGPVEIKSSGGVKIITAIRDAWLLNGQVTSFAQIMGMPKESLSDTYLIPVYNNVTLDAQLRFANVDTVATTITVKIGGLVQGTYNLGAGESLRVAYAIDAGPVEIKSSNGAKIIVALRDQWKTNGQVTSFTQIMGMPKESLSDTYLIPVYNNVTLDAQLRFANVDTVATTITVKIGGLVQGTYNLGAGESLRVAYAIDAGPVEIKSSNGAKIIVALRDAWKVNGQVTSFSQMMGLPKEWLSTTFWFPAYNNITLDGQLRFSVP